MVQGVECLFGGGGVAVGCTACVVAECRLGEAVLDAGVGIDGSELVGLGIGREWAEEVRVGGAIVVLLGDAGVVCWVQ